MLICDHASPDCPPGCPCHTPHDERLYLNIDKFCTDSDLCPIAMQVVKCVEVE